MSLDSTQNCYLVLPLFTVFHFSLSHLFSYLILNFLAYSSYLYTSWYSLVLLPLFSNFPSTVSILFLVFSKLFSAFLFPETACSAQLLSNIVVACWDADHPSNISMYYKKNRLCSGVVIHCNWSKSLRNFYGRCSKFNVQKFKCQSIEAAVTKVQFLQKE